MTKKEFKEFIEGNKVKLSLAAGAVATIAIWAITRDKNGNYVDLPKPELNTGEWVQLFRGVKGKYKGGVTGMVNAVDVADLGEFGKKLTTVEGIDGHEPIRIIFGTERSFI